jgi:hypothetical protein
VKPIQNKLFFSVLNELRAFAALAIVLAILKYKVSPIVSGNL